MPDRVEHQLADMRRGSVVGSQPGKRQAAAELRL